MPPRIVRSNRGVNCRACHFCRLRKAKCDGSRPQCSYCIKRGYTCVYPRDGRYRADERASNDIALLEMEHREGLSPASGTRSPTIDGGQYDIGESSISFDSSNRHSPTAQPHSQPETGTASLGQSCNDNVQNQTRSDPHDGREQELSFFRSPTLSSDVDLDGLSPPVASHLLDLYWSNCHLEWILSYRPSIMGSLLEEGVHCNKILLNALYFSGAWYSSQVELRSDAADRTSTGLRFYSRICHLLTEDYDTPSFSTALGLLICSLSLVYRGKADAAWILSGDANRMLVLDPRSRAVGHIACHNDPGSNNLVKPRRPIDDLEEEQRKRLYLGAFSVDVFLSIFLGHAPTFDQGFIDSIEPILDNYEDFDDWTPYADSLTPNEAVALPKMNCSSYAVSTGVALIELLKIWHQVMYVFYGRVGKQDVKAAQECRTSVENKLHQWTESLPTHLRFDRLAYSARPPHQISLWTSFYALKILVRRPFLEKEHLQCTLTSDEICSTAEECVADAMEITDLVAAIETAFGIRHMTLFASFSAYLALSVMVDQCQVPTTELKIRIQSVYSVVRKLTVRTNLSLRDPLQAVERRMSGFVRDICCTNSSQEQSRGNLASEDAPPGIGYQRSNTKLIIPFTEVSQQGTLDSLHIDASGLSLISNSQVENEMSNTDNIAWFVNAYSSSTGPLGSTSWVCAAAEMSKSHPLVRDALHSVANLIRGKVSGVLELEQQGQQAYIGVLRRVNDAIGRSDECSDSLFYTVVLLSTIELFRRKKESSVSYHWNASLTLLERRGPLCHMTGAGHLIFTQLRLFWVTWALTTRTSTFLCQSQWKSVPWMAHQEKSILQLLLDELVELPAFLEQADKNIIISAEVAESTTKGSRQEALSAWGESIRFRLQQWKQNHADMYAKGQPYGSPQAVGLPVFRHWNADKTELVTPNVFQYPDSELATSVCMFNSALILLLRNLGPSPSSHQRALYLYAWDICRSVQFYIGSVSGPFLLELEFPLRIAYETFAEGSVERTFITEVCHLVSSQYKLEIFSGIIEPK
ncbi:Nitrogen assimilation transcription factor nirA [Talaromyces pinophilus]|nr:Nitrogen assimilation transcription factor nirA [Talaromyces pinophilus]